MKQTSSNATLKTFMSQSGFMKCNQDYNQLVEAIKILKFLPKINYEDLHFMLLGIYQLKVARQYLRDCFLNLTMYFYEDSNEDIQIIKFVNAKSRYKRQTNRTIILVLEKQKLLQMKQIQNTNEESKNNLWNAIHYWCNCNRGTCTVTPCSHVIMVMHLIYCVHNEVSIVETKHNEKLLHAIDFGVVYKKWALKNEKTCIPTCKTYGYHKNTMIKCSGCQNAYHYKCLEKETGITSEDLKRQNNTLMCNIGQPCLYLRNQKFITQWLQKYGQKN